VRNHRRVRRTLLTTRPDARHQRRTADILASRQWRGQGSPDAPSKRITPVPGATAALRLRSGAGTPDERGRLSPACVERSIGPFTAREPMGSLFRRNRYSRRSYLNGSGPDSLRSDQIGPGMVGAQVGTYSVDDYRLPERNLLSLETLQVSPLHGHPGRLFSFNFIFHLISTDSRSN